MKRINPLFIATALPAAALLLIVLAGCAPASTIESNTPSTKTSAPVSSQSPEAAPAPAECSSISLELDTRIDGDDLAQCLIASAKQAGSYEFTLTLSYDGDETTTENHIDLDDSSVNTAFTLSSGTRSEVIVVGAEAWGDLGKGTWTEASESQATVYVDSAAILLNGSIFSDHSHLNFTVTDTDATSGSRELTLTKPTVDPTTTAATWTSASLEISDDFTPRHFEATVTDNSGKETSKTVDWASWGTVPAIVPPSGAAPALLTSSEVYKNWISACPEMAEDSGLASILTEFGQDELASLSDVASEGDCNAIYAEFMASYMELG